MPFWLYDYQADYDYAGEGIKVRRWTSGDTEYTETSYSFIASVNSTPGGGGNWEEG